MEIEKLCIQKKFDDLIPILVDQNKELKRKFTDDISNLKSEISSQNKKIKHLESQNKKLLKEDNHSLVERFSNELIQSIQNEDLTNFKKIIEEEDFPVNEYIICESEKVIILKFIL